MAEPWLAEMALEARSDGDLLAADGCTLGRGFSTTSPNGAKASRVRGVESMTIPGPVSFCVCIFRSSGVGSTEI